MPANAAEGLYTASMLAPEDEILRLIVARQYLEEGKAAEARAALGPAAYNPHNGAMAAFATALLKASEKDGAAAAVALWKELEGKAGAAARDVNTSDGGKTKAD